jgi:hypothetical protein
MAGVLGGALGGGDAPQNPLGFGPAGG